MTLRIDVNVPPRLIERAREQQVERRLAKAAEQRQAVVRKEAARQVALQRLATGKDAQGNDVRGGALEDQRRRWFGAQAVMKMYKFILVCNSNGLADDNFILVIDNEDVGLLDFSKNAKVGYLFTWTHDGAVNKKRDDTAISTTEEQPTTEGGETDKIGSLEMEPTITLKSYMPEESSKTLLTMRNAQMNNNGNFGNIVWGTIGRGADGPETISIKVDAYSPNDGEDWSSVLAWDQLEDVKPPASVAT